MRASEEALTTQNTYLSSLGLSPEMRRNSDTVPYCRGSAGTPFFHSDQWDTM
jgi:hypothetical protein